MSTKSNIQVGKVLKGVPINSQHEVNYSAKIEVDLDKDVNFEYSIEDEGFNNANVIFTSARKKTVITFSNTDGYYRKKILLVRSDEPVNASITIQVEKCFHCADPLESMGPRAQVLLSGAPSAGANNDPWYKDPWVIGIIAVIVLVVFLLMSKRNNNAQGSIFLD